ncbi:unnamed protein product [Sphenostylis stenocarpa]|uniref:Uncharacterized protein n=1 Tax=Sphenostylis stenocarpa TaxID=92480 RepID=A0AA86VYD3_9FABA|nr:unnamed protein product [Sphenostylis stenocarpa]
MANRIEFRSETEKEKNENRKIAKWKQAIRRRRREVLLKRNQKQNPKLLQTLTRKCLSARSNLSHYNFTEKLRLMGKRKVALNYWFLRRQLVKVGPASDVA